MGGPCVVKPAVLTGGGEVAGEARRAWHRNRPNLSPHRDRMVRGAGLEPCNCRAVPARSAALPPGRRCTCRSERGGAVVPCRLRATGRRRARVVRTHRHPRWPPLRILGESGGDVVIAAL